MLDATLPVVSRRCPGRSVSDQNRLSGLWFHCHWSPRSDPFHAFSADSAVHAVTHGADEFRGTGGGMSDGAKRGTIWSRIASW